MTTTLDLVPVGPLSSASKDSLQVPLNLTSLGQTPVPDAESSLTDELKRALLGIADIPSSLSNFTAGTVEEFGSDPSSALKNLIQGGRQGLQDDLAKGLQNLVRPAEQVAGQLPGIGPVLQEAGAAPQIPEYMPDNPEAHATRLGRLIADWFPQGGALKGASVLGDAAEKLLPEFLGKKLATRVGTGALGGAGAAQVGGVSPEQGALTGGALSGLGAVLGPALSKAVGARATLPQIEQTAAAVPPGIRAPVGDLVDSPLLKQAYGVLGGVIGSGANAPYTQLNEVLRDAQNKLMEAPTDVPDANQYFYDAKSAAYKAAKDRTQNAYDNLAALGDQNNVPLDRSILNSEIEKAREPLSKEMITDEARRENTPLIAALDDYKDSPINTWSDGASQIKFLNRRIRALPGLENAQLRRIYTVVKDGLQKSMESSAQDTPELTDALNSAKSARIDQGKYEMLNKKQETPFYKVFSNQADPGDLIKKYIQKSTSTSDKSGLLASALHGVGDDARRAMGAAYLDHDSMAKFSKAINDLNQKQRNLLFEEQAPVAEQVANISKTFPRAKSPDFVPRTGETGSKAAQLGKAMQAMGLLGGAYAAGHTGADVSDILATALAPTVGAYTGQQALRSNLLKNLYLRSLRKRAQGLPAISPVQRAQIRLALQGENNNGTR